MECNPNIIDLLIAGIRTFKKNNICQHQANVKKWVLEVKQSLFVIIFTIIITIHNIFFKETTVIRNNTPANSPLPFCSHHFRKFFWRKILKEAVYSSRQFDIQLEVPITQLLF